MFTKMARCEIRQYKEENIHPEPKAEGFLLNIAVRLGRKASKDLNFSGLVEPRCSEALDQY